MNKDEFIKNCKIEHLGYQLNFMAYRSLVSVETSKDKRWVDDIIYEEEDLDIINLIAIPDAIEKGIINDSTNS